MVTKQPIDLSLIHQQIKIFWYIEVICFNKMQLILQCFLKYILLLATLFKCMLLLASWRQRYLSLFWCQNNLIQMNNFFLSEERISPQGSTFEKSSFSYRNLKFLKFFLSNREWALKICEEINFYVGRRFCN